MDILSKLFCNINHLTIMKKIKKILFSTLIAVSNFFGRNIRIYKKIPFSDKIYIFLLQKFWPYGEIIEIQGSKMHLNILEENPVMRKTFQAYALNRIHEEATTNLFKKIVKEGDVVIDLGANIGYFALLAAKLVGPTGKVFAFEPEPQNFSYLKKNVELNNYTNVMIEQKAVSNYNRRTKLFICPYDSGHHIINRPNGIEAYRLG